ncbi:MAG: FGGY-family carbohydrate kinase, partial [Pseudomonadota bacterium]
DLTCIIPIRLFRHLLLKTRKFAFLPSKDWLNFRLTGRVCASRDSMTLFWVTDTRDPGNVRYDPGLIRRLGLDGEKLPPLVDSVDVVGELSEDVAREMGLPPGVPVVAGSPDHQCAAVGAGAVEDFMAHLYIGTSSWLQCPVPFKKTDVLHSIASFPFSVPGKYYAANEQDMAGGCVEFAARFLSADAPSVEAWAREAAPGAGGVLFAPWLNGERTPVDDPNARGAFFNLSKTTTRADLCRAVLEGVAANTRWSLNYVERFCGQRLEPIRFVGGGARSRLWCRILADALDREVWQMARPRQANARGAAFIAAVGLGHAKWEDLPGLAPVAERFSPNLAGRAVQDEVFSRLLGLYKRNRRAFARMNEAG